VHQVGNEYIDNQRNVHKFQDIQSVVNVTRQSAVILVSIYPALK